MTAPEDMWAEEVRLRTEGWRIMIYQSVRFRPDPNYVTEDLVTAERGDVRHQGVGPSVQDALESLFRTIELARED